MNDFLQTLFSLHSVQKFNDKQVPDAELKSILQAGMHAAAGGDNEKCCFLVLQDKDVLKSLNAIVKEAFLKWNTDESTNAEIVKNQRNSRKSNYNFNNNSPTLVVVTNSREYAGAAVDSACAIQNMLLAAHSMDIGSCWVNQLNWLREHPHIEEFLTKLGMPEKHAVYGSAALGYSDEHLQPVASAQNCLVKTI